MKRLLPARWRLRMSREPSHLILIGYWVGERAEGWPSPAQFVDKAWDTDEREIVADYLDRGFVTRAYMGLSPCRVCGGTNGSLELSDGVYVWPQGFSHYLRAHDVRPPDSFVEHVLAAIDRLERTPYRSVWWQSLTEP